MKILIRRLGSGWGGVYRNTLYDVARKKRIDLDKYFMLTKDKEAFSIDILHKKTKDFPQSCVVDFTPNISLLNFLPVCDLTCKNTIWFDIQIDEVYVLHKGKIRQVYDTDKELYPTNPALNAKLQKLIEYG